MGGLAVYNAQETADESRSMNLKVFILRNKSCSYQFSSLISVRCKGYSLTGIIYEERGIEARPVVNGLRIECWFIKDY